MQRGLILIAQIVAFEIKNWNGESNTNCRRTTICVGRQFVTSSFAQIVVGRQFVQNDNLCRNNRLHMNFWGMLDKTFQALWEVPPV